MQTVLAIHLYWGDLTVYAIFEAFPTCFSRGQVSPAKISAIQYARY
jgi:hypothetical protein